MGFLDRLFGRKEEPAPQQQPLGGYQFGRQPQPGEDERAIARYRYMLQTAPPETIEQAHAEAFAQLTPAQRQMVLQQLSAIVPEHERTATPQQDDPRSLARMATRAEMRQPGTLERTFGGMGGMSGMGMGFGGTILTSIAGAFIGTAIAQQFFDASGSDQGFAEGYDQGAQDDVLQDADFDTSTAEGGVGGGDFGGDVGGDVGGDFGGVDF